MKMLGNITTKHAAHEVRMDDIASRMVVPGDMADAQPGPSHEATKEDHPRLTVPDDQDQFHGIEEQVCCRVSEHLRRSLPTYLPTTDDDSGAENEVPTQPRKKDKGTLGKLRTADTTVINQVTWPHKLIYTPSGQPVIYNQLNSVAFLIGYLAVMVLESDQVKEGMLAHLQEMMQDGEVYGWSMVRSYHAACPQHLEQGRAMWDYKATKLKLR